LLTLEPITQNGYFRRKADITWSKYSRIGEHYQRLLWSDFKPLVGRQLRQQSGH